MWNNLSDTISTLAVFGVVGSVVCFYAAHAEDVHNNQVEENSSDASLANGFGEHIEWKTLKHGFELAKAENKFLMLIIHKSWCGACKGTKKISIIL